MSKEKNGRIKIHKGFVLGYVALGVVVMAAGVVMGSFNSSINADTTTAITISTPTTISPTNLSYEDKDIIVASTLTVGGQHKFNSLRVTSSGIITHDPILVTDVQTDKTSLTTSGADKKVDLIVKGTTTIDPGGKFDVSGKGFPGADPTLITANCALGNCGKGNGPGAGTSHGTYDEYSVAAGAGHGGKGANGRTNASILTAVLGGVKYDASTGPVIPGSSGGSVKRWRHGNSNVGTGGKGGGVIHLQTRSFVASPNATVILANGAGPATGSCDTWAVCAGSGSGGSVFIEITNKSLQGSNVLTGNVDAGSPPSYNTTVAADTAEKGVLTATSPNDINITQGIMIQAKGGSGIPSGQTKVYGAPGAGGYVTVAYKPIAENCPDIDDADVSASAWTQNWCLVDQTDPTKYSGGLLRWGEKYQCTFDWCGGATTAKYDKNWAAGYLYNDGTGTGTAGHYIYDYVGFKSARKFNVPTAGNYKFTLESDDGSEVYIDSDKTALVTTNYTAGRKTAIKELTAGDHIVRVNYREAAQNAKIYFTVEAVVQTPTPTPITTASATVTTTVTATATQTVTTTGTPTRTPTPSPVASGYTIPLQRGFTYFNVPSDWGVVQVDTTRSSNNVVIWQYNWFGDEYWQPTQHKVNVTTLRPGVGYYASTDFGSQSLVFKAKTDDGAVPIIKPGWNLLSNNSTSPIDVASKKVRMLKAGQSADCNAASCSEEVKTIKELVDAAVVYDQLWLIRNATATDPDTAFGAPVNARLTGAQIPGASSTDTTHTQGYWIYSWGN